MFVKAITIIKALSTRSGYGSLPRPPLESRVGLYGLYKQATEGDVEGIIARPTGNSKEDVAAKNKWDAWKQQQGLSITAAKRKYISYLIDTMRIYATGTHEARELLAELEYLWDQIRDIESDSEGDLNESGVGVSAGVGSNNNNNSNDAVLSPYPYAQQRLSNSNSQNYITSISDHNVNNSTSANVNVSSAANNYNNLLYREISRQSSTSNANILPIVASNPNVNVNATANPNITNGLLLDLYEKTGSNTEEIRSLKKEIKWAIESLNQEIKLLKHYNHDNNEAHNHSRHASHDNHGHDEEAGGSVITASNANTRNIRKTSQYQQQHQQDNDMQSIITSMYRYPVLRAGTTKVTQLPYASKLYLFNNNYTNNNTVNNANTTNANSIMNNDSFFDDRSSIIGGGGKENKHWLLSRQPTLRNTHNNNNNRSSDNNNNNKSVIAKFAISVSSTLSTIFHRVKLLNTKYHILAYLKDIIKRITINAVILFVVFKILNQRIRLVRSKDGSVVVKLDDRVWKGPVEKIKKVVVGGFVSASGDGG